MSISRSALTVAVITATLLSTAAFAESPEQIEADRARGQQVGYNACKTVCRPTVPIGNQTSAGFASGWITGCTQAGGLTAACSKTPAPAPTPAKPPVTSGPNSPQLQLAAQLFSDSRSDVDRASALLNAAQQKANSTSGQDAQKFAQLAQLARSLADEGSKLRDQAHGLYLAIDPQQQQLDDLGARLRDYEQRVRDAEQKFTTTSTLPDTPVTPPTQMPPSQQPLSRTDPEPDVSAKEAADFIRSHSELIPKAQNIVRSMKASGKSDKQIELALRQFVADNRVTITDPPIRWDDTREAVQVAPLKGDEIKQFVADNPAVKKQMQDYAADLRRQGKSEQQVLQSVYNRLNEIHADQVRSGRPAQAPQRMQSGEVGMYRSDPVRQDRAQSAQGNQSSGVQPYEADRVRGTYSQDLAQSRAQNVQQIESSDIEQQRAQQPSRFRARRPRRDRAQSVRESQSEDVQATQAEEVQEYRAQNVQRDRAQRVRGYRAQDVQPYQAQDTQPYQAEEVKPYQAQDVQQRRADNVNSQNNDMAHVRESQDIEPYRAQNPSQRPPEIGPDPSRYPRKRSENRPVDNGGSSFMHTFGLAVPGVAYSYDNYATNTRTIVTAAGTPTKSAIRINPDHTYVWNSAWDGKVIRGRWTEWEGGIRLSQAQEGKDWLMHKLSSPSGKATVVLYTESVQYHGTPLD